MMIENVVGAPFSPAYLGYLLAFVASAAACLGAAWRAQSAVPYADTRRALTWFFSGSTVWAGAYVGFLLVDSALWKHLFYQGSLIVGFATVFAWIWFCSAYSGRGLHRNRKVQGFALALYLAVTALKVTNPLHGLYYGLEPTGTAFGLVVTHEPLYWVVMALAYALAAAGYLMIYELFLNAEADVFPLAVLTGLTALPAALNVIGHMEPALLDITHEPLGVAVFAIGLLFTYETQFSVVQLSGSVEEPNLTVGPEGRIRGFGGGIGEIVPPLREEALGRPLAEVLPGLAQTIREKGEAVWRASFDGDEEKECRDPGSPSEPRLGQAPELIKADELEEDTQPEEDIQPGGDSQPSEDTWTRGSNHSEKASGLEGSPQPEKSPQLEESLPEESLPEENCRYFQVVQAGIGGLGETYTVVLSDITERKQRARRLRKAKEEAEEASRMKSAMLANMSHEIRTPLTGVIGFAEAIGEETGEEGTVAHFADLIEDSGRRLLDTLDAVLNLSKLEAGQMTLESRPTDLAEQARQIAQQFAAEAEESGLTLKVETEETTVRADKGGLKIVLQNLLSNAIKYTEDGGVAVRTYQEDEAAILEIEDTGIGMDPEVAKDLFEPFRQASEGMSREYEGTGIGLAVTKKATEEMGGSMEVETQKGEGSRFTVRLPQAISPDPDLPSKNT